jgi:hypothetical protein
VLPDMIGKTAVVRGGGGWRRTLGLGQRCAKVKKIISSDTMLERGVPPKVKWLYCLMDVHIYRGTEVLRGKTHLNTYDSLQYIISILPNIF